jgi:hypothetical protein
LTREVITSARPQPAIVSALSFVLLCATGIYGIGFWALHDEGPEPEAIEIAAKALRAEHRRGDLIFLAPFYATRAREWLGDLHPLAVQDPLLEDFAVHPRAWVFGLFESAEELRPRMIAAGHALEKTMTPAPGITIDLYRTFAESETAYAFTEQLRSARVHHETYDGRTPCAEWMEQNGQGGAGGRWSCPQDKEWFYVAPEWHRMGDHPRRCLWAHPPTRGRLVMEYPGVPLSGVLYGRGGHTTNSQHHARAPLFLDVTIGNSAPQRFVFELEDNFRPFMVKTATTGTATISFAVSSPDAGANHFCFDAEMRREVVR